MTQPLPEVWLRGALEGVPPLLQPVAHALLQMLEETTALMQDFPDHLLWERPVGNASPGFHLLHVAGVLDRLGTYARGEALNETQLTYLKRESEMQALTTQQLVGQLEAQVQKTITQLKTTNEDMLTERRSVGRKALPSTVLGLLFHAAEHSMRHLGQLLVTVKMLRAK